MSNIGNGLRNDNFLQWNGTKAAWASSVESGYVHLTNLTSSGTAVAISAADLSWQPLVPASPTWTIAKGVSTWNMDASGITIIGDPTPYLGQWMELEVKAVVYQSGAGYAANSTIALAVAQQSDGVAGTSAFPKFEQRVFLPGSVTPSEWVECSFKNAIQWTQSGVRLYTRMLNTHGGVNINFVTAQLTIRPL